MVAGRGGDGTSFDGRMAMVSNNTRSYFFGNQSISPCLLKDSAYLQTSAGVVDGQQNMLEEGILEHAAFRKT
jgi:hypothetical protein